VNDAGSVRVGKRCRDVMRDRARLEVIERLLGLETIGQRSTREVLEHEIGPTFGSAVVKYADDVWMGESSSRMCLAFEAELVSPGTSKLQGDRSIEFSIMREPDFAHTAGTNFFAELIAVGDRLPMPQWWQSQLSSLGMIFPCRPDEKPGELGMDPGARRHFTANPSPKRTRARTPTPEL
jgi:hypothetical protein